MFAIGSVAAPSVSIAPYVVGQLMVTFGQLTAHYANEYADVGVDRSIENRTLFSGGSGVLVEGTLLPSTAFRAAMATTVATLAAATFFVAVGRPATALLSLVALIVSWEYSMPPVRLLESGWGELATTLVVVVLVPCIGVTSQGAPLPTALLWTMAGLFPIHLAMMLAFEIPDLESDARSGKTVVAVRLGRSATIRLIVGAYAAAASILVIGVLAGGLPGAAGAALLYLPPAAGTVAALSGEKYRRSGLFAVLAVGVAGISLLIVS